MRRQTTSPWSWAIAGALAGLLLVTLVYAPARWLTGPLQAALGERVVFEDAQGSVWNGSARLGLSGGAGSNDAAVLPGRLSWTIRPQWSGLRVELQAECCMQQAWRMTVQPQWGGASVALADSLSQWPAHWLTGLGTPWNTVQAEGQLTLATQGLVVQWAAGRVLLAGRVQLDATQISSRLSTLKPMGSYRIVLLGGASPSIALETLEGSLQLSGSGQWVGSKLRFEGLASAAPERLEALSNLLNIIGRRDGARAIIKVG
ncbi:MAG: type II secretion system protein N [Rhodoferax sp.]